MSRAREWSCQVLGLGLGEAVLRSGREVPCSAIEPETRTEDSGGVAVRRKGLEALGLVREPTQTGQRETGTLTNLLQRQGRGRKRMWR